MSILWDSDPVASFGGTSGYFSISAFLVSRSSIILMWCNDFQSCCQIVFDNDQRDGELKQTIYETDSMYVNFNDEIDAQLDDLANDIPCEFCGRILPVSDIRAHQVSHLFVISTFSSRFELSHSHNDLIF